MNVEEVRLYALAKPGAGESLPFTEGWLVFKVGGKIFASLLLDGSPHRMWLKAKPEEIINVRMQFPSVTTTPYTNKRHWNNIPLDGSLPENLERQLIDESYSLVVAGLSKKLMETLT